MDMSLFTGEFGGTVAVAFGMGAAAGWGFAQRTIIKASNERLAEIREEHAADKEEMKAEIADLRARVRELDDVRFEMARESGK